MMSNLPSLSAFQDASCTSSIESRCHVRAWHLIFLCFALVVLNVLVCMLCEWFLVESVSLGEHRCTCAMSAPGSGQSIQIHFTSGVNLFKVEF